jgi:hypothetical protein
MDQAGPRVQNWLLPDTAIPPDTAQLLGADDA